MTPVEKYYEATANTVIANLKKRNMDGSYAKNSEEAVKQAMSFLKKGMTVSSGGSMTLEALGVMDAAQNMGCDVLVRRKDFPDDERRAFFAKVSACDCYFMSTNAITKDGILYNIDGSGNRVASLIHGPEKVVIIAGINKVVADIYEAESRVRNTASPENAIRLDRNTPCTRTGFCADCQSDDCICCNAVITRRGMIKGRIHVIIVGEPLGY